MSGRALLGTIAIVVVTIITGTLIMVTAPLAPSGRLMMRFGRRWSRVVLALAGVRVEIEHAERARPAGAVLFMANHQSLIDVPAIALVMPDSLHFVAKKALAWVPFLGWAMLASGGCIFVDRGNREAALRSLRRAGERIRRGECVLVFPEGTRSRDGRLQEFKKGPFHLAAEARVPIVPILVEGTRRLLPTGHLFARPGRARVRFGEPIDVHAGDAPAAIAERVRSALMALGAEPTAAPEAQSQ